MKFFPNLFGRKGQAQSLIALQSAGQPVTTPRNYEQLAKEGYVANVVVHRSINMIATACSSIPLYLYKKSARGKEREEIETHPLLDLLDRPNALEGYEAFITKIFSYLMLSGNAFLEANGPTEKKITELWVLRPDRMKIIPGPTGLPGQYIFKIGEKQKVFEMDAINGAGPIMHLKTFHPLSDWYGMAALEAAAYAIDTHNAGSMWNLSLLQNGGKQSGILKLTNSDQSTGRATPEQRRQLADDMKSKFQGAKNAGGIVVVDGDMDYKELGYAPKDMDYKEGKNATAGDIAMAFGVPTQLLGIPGSQTYANYEQALIAFYQFAVLPAMGLLTSGLNRWLVPFFGEGLELGFDEDSIPALEPLKKDKWERAKSSFLTINEARGMVGYSPYKPDDKEPGDHILVGSGLTPLEFSVEASTEVDPVTDTEDVEESRGGDDDDKDPEEESADEGFELEDDETEEAGKSVGFIDGKMFRLDTKARQNRYWSMQERRRMKFERQMRAELAAYFKHQGDLMEKNLSTSSLGAAELVVSDVIRNTRPRLKQAIEKNLRATAEAFGRDILKNAKGALGLMEVKDDSESTFERAVSDFISKQVGTRITGIESVSRKRVLKKIKDVLDENLSEGETLSRVSKEIQASYKGFSTSRATTIARTETHDASQFGQVEAARALNDSSMQKQWVAAIDERTREAHVQISETQVPLNEKFDVSGDSMDRPGDPDAPADQVINCRCVLAFSREAS